MSSKMSNKYASANYPGLYSGCLPDIEFPVRYANIGFELVSVCGTGQTDDPRENEPAILRYIGFDQQEIPALLEEAGEWQNFTKPLSADIVAKVKDDHPWFQTLVPKEDFQNDFNCVYVKIQGVRYCRFDLAPEGVYPDVIAEYMMGVSCDENTNPLWAQNKPGILADSELMNIGGGFNVVKRADMGSDPESEDCEYGSASVDFVGWNPNYYLPWSLKEAGLVLWDNTCGDSTQNVRAIVYSDHPWFNSLVPTEYPHGGVWLVVKELRYVKMSGWVPDGIYYHKISDFVYQQRRLRPEAEEE